ncbi:MAG: hypothetical protein ACK55I_49270, partial [bacterium]
MAVGAWHHDDPTKNRGGGDRRSDRGHRGDHAALSPRDRRQRAPRDHPGTRVTALPARPPWRGPLGVDRDSDAGIRASSPG